MGDNLIESSGPGPRSNAAEFTVSEISNALKRTVEDAFGHVRVRGEVSGYRGPHSSGHAYFSLKDDKAKIDAVVWRTTMQRLKFRPEEGMEVIATGKLTTYPGKSSYQIVIDNLEPAGAGALMALLEERKRRLAAEGLFDRERKRPLPYMPRAIGVVTSPTGAVIRDIIHRIKDRFPLHVIVWPVRVQGETSGPEVAAAVSGFNMLAEGGAIARPDIIIVARGGGSLEDLWGFNDEALARTVAASGIPVISAVGHETDWTLIDHAADVRAPTPTGAAEFAVPVKAELEATLAGLSARLKACMSRSVERKRTALRAAARALPSPDQLLALPRRRFDEATSRLGRALEVSTERKRARLTAARLTPAVLARRLGEARRHLNRAGQQLPKCARATITAHRRHLATSAARLTPAPLERRLAEARRNATRDLQRARGAFLAIVRERRGKFDRARARLSAEPIARRQALQHERLQDFARRADQAVALLLERNRTRLDHADRLLATLALSDQAILDRGYALVIGADGELIKRAAEVSPGAELTLKFADGTAQATGGGMRLKSPRPAGKTRDPGNQGSLF
ncbi:exodeoxyribonuclease VII large subunit [Mesorhizobium sp. ZMM04-5]|uniref:Exodeoxyribonuclease 7 large subunit n=1 Tax=Mesorhizobium marinum TaxID=3228790 RepID=A0ABV3R440_9HYPH